eukprot:comp73140_c0_seq1/m.48180 comp73140_c0_seq1/g.48180  ORF comp73140_c0_seq1/g.48180 comp73140_c0_seq1/m.48180 type:complete len:267 (-) comp73140_c0_seq1:371-1171(-)
MANSRELCESLRERLDIRNRKYRFVTYRDCFVGCEAVSAMIDNGYAQDREDAIRLGNLLVQEGYIEHVTKDHTFKDDKLFYRFVSPKEEPFLSVNVGMKKRNSGDFSTGGTNKNDVMKAAVAQFHHGFQPNHTRTDNRKRELKYFSGGELVGWLLQATGLEKDKQAQALGQLLLDTHQIFDIEEEPSAGARFHNTGLYAKHTAETEWYRQELKSRGETIPRPYIVDIHPNGDLSLFGMTPDTTKHALRAVCAVLTACLVHVLVYGG